MKMAPFWCNSTIFIKMSGDSQFYRGTLNSGLKTLRGVAKYGGYFSWHDTKIIKWHKIHLFHKNNIKLVKFHKNQLFCITETPKSAELTKQYEFLLQIGPFSTRITRNPLLGPKRTFSLKGALGAKSALWREKSTLGPQSALLRPGGSKHQFGLTF